MEKFRNKVVATDYVEKNYIHKDKIRQIIEDVSKIVDNGCKEDGFYAYLGKLNYLLIYGDIKNEN